MHDHEKSDRPVLPVKPPNKPGEPGAEVVEGRGLPEGNTAGETRPGLSAGEGVSSELDRVRQVARKDKDVRFTALLHHVTVDRLRDRRGVPEPPEAVLRLLFGEEFRATVRISDRDESKVIVGVTSAIARSTAPDHRYLDSNVEP